MGGGKSVKAAERCSEGTESWYVRTVYEINTPNTRAHTTTTGARRGVSQRMGGGKSVKAAERCREGNSESVRAYYVRDPHTKHKRAHHNNMGKAGSQPADGRRKERESRREV